MFLVGLTGGIGTGKSVVSKICQDEGIPVVDADKISHEVSANGSSTCRRLMAAFGPEYFDSSGNLDRKKLGRLVFNDPEQRRKLNSIVHPAIRREMGRQILIHFLSGHSFVVLDIPLLFETKTMLKFIHETIVVSCFPSQQLERILVRDQCSPEDALSRINGQMPINQKVELADHVIDNSGDLLATRQQTCAVIAELQTRWTHWKFRAAVAATLAVMVAGAAAAWRTVASLI